jgi:hypothetical protein
MRIHDWTRVPAGIFHDFRSRVDEQCHHQAEISNELRGSG